MILLGFVFWVPLFLAVVANLAADTPPFRSDVLVMERNCRLLTISLFLGLLGGCSHTVTIRTEPSEATLYQVDLAGKRTRNLGKSPVNLSDLVVGDILGVEVQSPGHERKVVYVPMWSQTSLDMQISLSEVSGASIIENYPDLLNKALEDLIELQTSMVSFDDKDVEKRIEALRKAYDKLPIFHTMQGAYWYRKRNLEKSKSAYRRALTLDPDNSEARSVLNLLGEKAAPAKGSGKSSKPANKVGG